MAYDPKQEYVDDDGWAVDTDTPARSVVQGWIQNKVIHPFGLPQSLNTAQPAPAPVPIQRQPDPKSSVTSDFPTSHWMKDPTKFGQFEMQGPVMQENMQDKYIKFLDERSDFIKKAFNDSIKRPTDIPSTENVGPFHLSSSVTDAQQESAASKDKKQKHLQDLIDFPNETKYVDVLNNVTSNAVLELLNGVAQGDDHSHRDGRLIHMKCIKVRGYISNKAVTTTDRMIRLSIIYDHSPNGIAPSYNDLYETPNPHCFQKKNTLLRFTILKEYYTVLHARTATSTATPSIQYFNIYLNTTFPTWFIGSTAAITDIRAGAVYFVWTDNTNGNIETQCVFDSRIEFVDDTKPIKVRKY